MLALLAVLVVTQVIHSKPVRKRLVGGGTVDCVREGFDAWGRAHPNGGRAT